ncbi:transmembrane sensor [Pedobacter africanus]|uniref:Ferric-dicitrate binding protein FerR (Iron transport regulator) n=1 Tax=Pedobacter africanus TaxID=151894 RepID=A0ACC6KZG5_9SPHI|nr:FecR domain-containing protein [Pedobacter africanus]MDR6784626.1 ferric-dicitrate binding protein FerR (iron transport regulator) [Pedobacter africanus]
METQSTQRLKYLFHLQISGKATETEYSEWMNYFDDPLYIPVIDELMADAFAESDGRYSLSDFQRKTVLNRVFKQPVTMPAIEKKIWKMWIAAAAMLIILGSWFYYSFNQNNGSKGRQDLLAARNIGPGKNGATITLNNGETIQLSDTQNGVLIAGDGLAYTDGSPVSSDLKLRSGQAAELTASTAKGQTYIFTLPDGTKVWLNAESKISFAQQFVKKTREVFLEGEAYFEVTKNKLKPFIVKSRNQQVEVLGTHFNVSSYKNEGSVKTSLLEGSVRVRQTGTAGNEVVLEPSQQANNNFNNLKISHVDPKEVLDWKNGGFAFNGGDFAAGMRKIARWYNVEIIYDPVAVQKMEIGGFVSRKNDLATVLKFIESTGQVRFAVEGRRVLVKN